MPSAKPTNRVPDLLPLSRIEHLCQESGVRQLAIFGSVLRPDFRPDSDVDFLVRFKPEAERPWMGHFDHLQEELKGLLGRDVDLVDWDAVEKSRNWIRRQAILGSAQLLYAA